MSELENVTREGHQQGGGQIISLDGTDWQLGKAADDGGLPDTGWLPASVPGNVQADLEAAHCLKPLWYGAGDARLHEAAQHAWWYRKSFFVPAHWAGKRLTLAFEGVDFSCTVWLNGHELGSHAGMFRPFTLDAGPHVRLGRDNELVVRIDPAPAELLACLAESDGAMSGGGPEYPANPGPHFFVNGINRMRQLLGDLKSPTNFGWDWGVNIYTLGIWRGVRLEATGAARIESLRVESKLNDNYRKAELLFETEVESGATIQATAEFVVTGPNGTQTVARDLSLSEGRQQINVALTLHDPRLWWPNGHGQQALHTLEVHLRDRESGRLLDRRMTRFGIREIRWHQVTGAPSDFINPFRLVVNGRPIRMMGSNILPPDLLFGRMNERGPRLLELARHAGFNVLRVWGGGALLTDEMYDLADELGIMLSQEFPLANCVPESDPVFLQNLAQTTRAILRRLRNHPCIIEWSGGNEMMWRQGDDHPALHILERETAALDGRIFRATCPMQGSRHSPWNYNPRTHYRHYDDAALTDNLGGSPLMRYGEFGCGSPAHLETWLRQIPPADRWPADSPNNAVLIRKNVIGAVFEDDFWLQKSNIEALFGPMGDLPALITAGQFVAADALRYAVDALRRRGSRLGGLTTWDFNEPWPNGAGSYLVDYDGRPLMSYAFMRQAVAPLALSLQYDSNLYEPTEGLRAAVWLVSDAPDTAAGLRWEWCAADRWGRPIGHGRGESDVLPQQAVCIDRIALEPPGDAAGIILLELRLHDEDGRLLFESLHLVGPAGRSAPLGGALPGATGDAAVGQTTIRARAAMADGGDELHLHITNDGPIAAFYIEAQPLITYRTDLLIDDNYIFVPPGETRTITIRPSAWSTSTLSLAQTGWRITAWNAPDVVIPPESTVLLAVGRHDAMCGEFMAAEPEPTGVFRGKRPDSANIPYRLGGRCRELRFLFDVAAESTGRDAQLFIYTADRAGDGQTHVTATLSNPLSAAPSDHVFRATLDPGLGIQATDPAHLAFPAAIVIDLPATAVSEGKNSLQLIVDEGWLTLDAIIMTAAARHVP